MHPFVGTYDYIIDAYLTDFKGKATLPMLGGFMLQAATRHAEERGFGYSSMAKLNKVWVLSRMNIEIMEYPQNDTKIHLNTWVAEVNKIFTERCFSIQDQEGNFIGYARSVWACIDLENRRPTNVLELEGLIDYVIDNPCPIDSPAKIGLLKDGNVVSAFRIKYSDIDINKHLNSMKYIEHFVDVFPIGMFQDKEIRRFEINYINEGLYGSKIEILKDEVANDHYVLEMKNEEKHISLAKVLWKN